MSKHLSQLELVYAFIDFDGVTHPAKCEVDQLFVHAEKLACWALARPQVRLVISSSWREVHPMSELRDFFPESLSGQIIGATPRNILKYKRRSDGTPAREREAEVRAWLRRHGAQRRPWVAVDDQPWRFRSDCKHLVLCDPDVGLTAEIFSQMDEHLGLSLQIAPAASPGF